MHKGVERVPTIRLVNVYVSDLDYAKDWYCKVLGFELAQDLPPLAAELRHEGIVFLLHQAKAPTARQFWTESMVTLAFATDDVHEAMKTLKASGVKLIHSEPQFSPLGDWFAFEDPFGNVHEMVQFNDENNSLNGSPESETTR